VPRIVSRNPIAPDVVRLEVEAPKIARKRKAGQFVIVRAREGSERIPLTIAEGDAARGTITLVVQTIGRSTRELGALEAGGEARDVAGPLGVPTEVERYGTCAAIGGGIGTAVTLPIAAALKAVEGNRVLGVVGARTKELLILLDEMRAASHELAVATDDGSAGTHGFVTDVLKAFMEREKLDFVFAAGPVPMMRAVAETTRAAGIRTIVSLNPLMVDGTGMCGGCRVTVGGRIKFACVDGPEFDGHEVDFDELVRRQRLYVGHESDQCRMKDAP